MYRSALINKTKGSHVEGTGKTLELNGMQMLLAYLRLRWSVWGFNYCHWSWIFSLFGSACVFHPAGITAYQSYPWGNMCSQPAMHQRTQCPPAYPGSLGPGREHQPTSSTIFPLPSFFPGEDQESLHANSQDPSLNQTFTSSTTSTATVLPPVSTLLPSCLRVEDTPARESLLMPSQVTQPLHKALQCPLVSKLIMTVLERSTATSTATFLPYIFEFKCVWACVHVFQLSM